MSVDSLDLIKTFHEVASRGSFSKAAVSLQLSKATASKYVAELERRLGVRLLHRSTRAISLTDAGQRLLERSTYLVSYAEEMMDELREFGSLPKGGLTLSAPYGLVFGGFSDIIATYVRSYPDVRLTLRFTNEPIDLIREGVDLHFGSGTIADQQLIARRVMKFDLVLCAAPAYWERFGKPATLEELTHHNVLQYSAWAAASLAPARRPDTPVAHRLGVIEVNDPVAVVQLALRGVGIAVAPKPAVAFFLANGELVQALDEHMPTDLWVYAAYSERRHKSAALSAMLRLLDRFGLDVQ